MREEITPAPLPPSPAADAADVWFDQVPTNPAAVPDLGALTKGPEASAHGASTNPIRRQPTGDDPWSAAPPAPAPRADAQRPPWVLPVLIAATCLAVGMVFGALIFGATGKKAATPQMDDAGVCRCVSD